LQYRDSSRRFSSHPTLSIVFIALIALPLFPQPTPPPMNPVPKLSEAEMEVFLQSANIVSQTVLNSGTTASVRATLSNGKITHDAHIQFVDVYKPVFRGRDGTVERNFRDSYKFNIAAYRLAKMLGIAHMVPVSVERLIDAKPGAMTWWVDNIWMTEADRRQKQIKPPATQDWSDQLNIVRVFDQLIYNTDRNQGNILITPEWKIWMIDHTRAFRTSTWLLKIESLGRCDYNLLEAMRNLNIEKLKEQLGRYLRPEEISGLLARRDLIVRHYEQEINQKGQDSVLTRIPRKTPAVSIP
jgi:hypothetical protein